MPMWRANYLAVNRRWWSAYALLGKVTVDHHPPNRFGIGNDGKAGPILRDVWPTKQGDRPMFIAFQACRAIQFPEALRRGNEGPEKQVAGHRVVEAGQQRPIAGPTGSTYVKNPGPISRASRWTRRRLGDIKGRARILAGAG